MMLVIVVVIATVLVLIDLAFIALNTFMCNLQKDKTVKKVFNGFNILVFLNILAIILGGVAWVNILRS